MPLMAPFIMLMLFYISRIIQILFPLVLQATKMSLENYNMR